LAGFNAIATPGLLLTAVSVFPSDHRRVVRGYFQHFRLQYAETPEAIRGTAPDGTPIVVDFDEHNRLGNVSVQASS
jgi:hypothetical protein